MSPTLVVLRACGVILAATLLPGCKKPPASPPPAAEQTAAPTEQEATVAQPQAAPPAPAAPATPAQNDAAQTVNGVVVPALTQQLRLFVQEKGRMPESFAEFAGARLDSVPRLQPGLTFAIDPTTQEVKIVRK